MRKFLLALILFFPLVVSAQNLNQEATKINYFRYAKEPLPEEVKTYNQEINVGYTPSGKSVTLVKNNIAKYAEIVGLEKVDGDADLSIIVEYEGFKISDLEAKSERREKKDKDGKVTPYTVYWYTFRYAFPVKMTVVNNLTGDNIYEKYVSSGFTSASTTESRSSKGRSDAYNRKKKELSASASRSSLNAMKNTLLSKYSYAPHTRTMYLRSVKKYKKFDFSEFNENVQVIKLALEKIQPVEDYMTDEIRNELNLAIEYFENKYKELDTDNKKAEVNAKIGGAILNNLSVAYYWLGEYDKVNELITATEDTKAKGWTSWMESHVEDRKSRLEVNGLL